VADPGPIVFLADAHLRGPTDPNQIALVKFLEELDPRPGGLVILGDLFDYLAGTNRAAEAAYRPVLQALGRFAPFHYVEGNHDFDLSASITGFGDALIHPGPATVRLQDSVVRLLHGDRTSPTDLGTRLLRRALQSAPLRFARDRLVPDRLAFRLALAFATISRRQTWPGRANEHSSARTRALDELAESDVKAVIYAHTHKARLEETDDGLIANPGPAVSQGSYLKLHRQTLSLHRFPDGHMLPPGPVKLRQPGRAPR
jgi:UDP-2,3-diacylglucosamine pyrophosphatase LpxH